MPNDPRSLKPKTPGQKISADEFNSLVAFANDEANPERAGANVAGRSMSRRMPGKVSYRFRNTTGVVIPPFSVFNVIYIDDETVGTAATGTGLIEQLIVTNGNQTVANNDYCQVEPILEEPTYVKASGVVPGLWCGPAGGVANPSGTGLLCLTAITGSHCWVVSSVRPVALVGKVTVQISARSLATPGSGTVAIQVNSPLVNLGVSLAVKSLHDQAILVDSYVSVTYVSGLGFTVGTGGGLQLVKVRLNEDLGVGLEAAAQIVDANYTTEPSVPWNDGCGCIKIVGEVTVIDPLRIARIRYGEDGIPYAPTDSLGWAIPFVCPGSPVDYTGFYQLVSIGVGTCITDDCADAYESGKIFAVAMEVLESGGTLTTAQGDHDTKATMTYDITNMDGNLVATALQPNTTSVSDWRRTAFGKYLPATRGTGYIECVAGNPVFILSWCNEVHDIEVCP